MSIIPQEVPTGAIRYNTDSNKMECFNGTKWWEVSVSSSDLNGSARALQAGGNAPSLNNNVIQFFTIETAGNAVDFGDLTYFGGSSMGAASSRTRALFATDGHHNTINYVTFSSKGDAVNFGDTLYTGRYKCGLSSQTRGIIAGGNTTPTSPATDRDNIDFVTIASTGDAHDFGNLSEGRAFIASCSSSTRGVFAAGYRKSSTAATKTVDYITIASTGDAQDFGDMSGVRYSASAGSNSTRGIISGGTNTSYTNTIEHLTIATLGNVMDFGDLTTARGLHSTGTSRTRAIFMGGYVSPGGTNVVDYVEILTTGNAVDFGDLANAPYYAAGCSNGHGGL